jgi:CHASE2 domain-containing sensor protein
LALWGTPLGRGWINASYDYLYRFGTRSTTNNVVLVLMDKEARESLGQSPDVRDWNRALHAQLLDRLTEGGSRLVVFDVLFLKARNPDTDAALAEAMRRNGQVVLSAKVGTPRAPGVEIATPVLPQELLLKAAAGYGIAKTEDDRHVPRQHWPYPAPLEGQPSLAWTAARLQGAVLHEKPEEQWLRYYGERGPWETFSYHIALSNTPAHFHGKVVFVGNKPETDRPAVLEEDQFRTPYTRWSGNTVGGVEIMATTFINLMNGDWLRRPPWWLEAALLLTTGSLIGAGLCRFRPLPACGVAITAGLIVAIAVVLLAQLTDFWIPWLVIVGGQIPCALAWALFRRPSRGS